MSVKRKWLTRITVSILTCSMILSVASCGDKPTTTTSGEKVTLEVAGWDYRYMKHEMAQAFEATHPNVDIVVHNSPEWEGNTYLQKMAAAGTMPDIFNVENPDYPIKNDWVLNLKPYLDKETELTIPQNYLDAGTYNGEIVMIPAALFVYGIIVNKDLLTANNLKVPEYSWTIDEMVNIAKKTTKLGASIGVSEVLPIIKHLQPQMNDDLDWAGFNQTTKHYQLTPEWVTAGNIGKDLYDSKVVGYEQIDQVGDPWAFEEGSAERTDMETQRKDKSLAMTGEESMYDAFLKGKVAMFMDFSWSIGLDDKNPDGTFVNPLFAGYQWDFYPFPVMEAGDVSRPGIVVDSKAISKTCKNPEEAYEYLKFITFSTEGSNTRLDLQKNYDQAKAQEEYKDDTTFVEADLSPTMLDTSIPVTNNQTTLNEWAKFVDAPPGFVYMLGTMETGYMDGYKITPGYNEAIEQTVQKQYKEQVLFGTASPADIAKDLEAQANAITDEAFAAMTK